ncbi:DUF6716 putative glycosyltransferase [uncultured Amnibacterium sp.]|uniref:DUF6716 putative glycosyltransferase n=1 Tax=uncultured Amnibacterium sp. TaxID=1631851 RepID=UPI0035CA394A
MAGFDSGLKYAARLADAFAAAGAAPVLALPTTVAPHGLGAEQIAAATDRPVTTATWAELVVRARGAAAVVPVFDGPMVQRFIRDVHGDGEGDPAAGAGIAAGPLPVFVAGYVGMALYDRVGGYLMRSLADVVAVNSRTDLAEFSAAAAALGLPAQSLLLCGLALLPATPAPPADGPIRSVLFTDQPTVPRTDVGRAIIWDRLAAYAAAHPDRSVVLKPRHRPTETTFHRQRFSPEQWAAGRTLPRNLRIDYAPIAGLIEASDLVLTVSSTAALEAIAAGTRVAFIADTVNDASLNPPLIASGLLRRFDDIDADRIGVPDPAWLRDIFPDGDLPADGGASPAARVAERALHLIRSDEPRPHRAAWDSGFHTLRRVDDQLLPARTRAARLRLTPRRAAAGLLRRILRRLDA